MSDVWHTPPETPNVFKPQPIIVVYKAGDQIEQMDSTEWSRLVGERYVNRWCYVDDLLDLENELECTRKELEQSEICCTEWEKQALDYKAENIALSGYLERTRKALDVAKDALKHYCTDSDNWSCVIDFTGDYDNTPSEFADEAIEQITELTKGGGNE